MYGAYTYASTEYGGMNGGAFGPFITIIKKYVVQLGFQFASYPIQLGFQFAEYSVQLGFQFANYVVELF